MTRTLPQTSRSLPIALLRARERVMGPIRNLLTSAGITEQQWRVLRVLQEGGPMEPTRIAEDACLLLPSLTRILQKLEEKDLIHRARDSRDRRKRVVQIAPGGEAIIQDNLEASVELAENLRTQMGPERYDMLLDLLNTLEQAETEEDADSS